MRGKLVLYINQYGSKYFARNLRELRVAVGGGRIYKMYSDTKEGESYHSGYVVGENWLTAYIPFRGN